jgi:hypothetical protein
MKHPTTFVFHHDPGHGWVAVKRSFLHTLGIADRITSYSYQRGATVYLEEDCDASTFEEAYIKMFGHKPNYKDSHNRSCFRNESVIRNYESYDRIS